MERINKNNQQNLPQWEVLFSPHIFCLFLYKWYKYKQICSLVRQGAPDERAGLNYLSFFGGCSMSIMIRFFQKGVPGVKKSTRRQIRNALGLSQKPGRHDQTAIGQSQATAVMDVGKIRGRSNLSLI